MRGSVMTARSHNTPRYNKGTAKMRNYRRGLTSSADVRGIAPSALAIILGLAWPLTAQAKPQPQGASAAQDAEQEASPAKDEPTGATSASGNEIIVTATKREQTLQSVPVAVTVTTAETIERAHILDVQDLATVVASLRVVPHQSSVQTDFIIRGFGNGANNLGIEPSVGVFIDGVYRSRSAAQISDFPDISRVEVLRGPQSTLFGKNASAGVVSITTQSPKFKLGANFEADYGNYNAVVLKGVVTGPVTDTLAVSLAGGYDRRDGYIRDGATGNKINDRNRWFVRGQALYEPNSQFKIRLIADYDKIDELCCAVVNVKPSGATQIINALGGRVNPMGAEFGGTVYNNFDSTNHIKNYGVSGQIDYNRGPFDLISITAWRKTRAITNQDSDFSSADLLGNNFQDSSDRTFTQELRLATSLPGPLNFVLGASYFDEKINVANQLSYGNQFRAYANGLIFGQTSQLAAAGQLAAPFGLGFVENALSGLTRQNLIGAFFAPGEGQTQSFALKDQAISIFGQADFKPVRKLTLTGGFNFTHDIKHFSDNIQSTDVFSNLPLPAIINGAIAGAFAQGFAAGGPAGGQAAAAAAAHQLVPLLALAPLQFMPAVLGVPNAVEPGRTHDNNLSFTARIAYEATKQVRLYANVSTGFKASSINLSRDSRPALADAPALVTAGLASPPTTNVAGLTITSSAYGSRFAGPEKSTLFELGLKANWGVASLNVAAFREIIRGFQQEIFTGVGFDLTNAGRESVNGFEVEGAVHPTSELTFTEALTYLKPKYDSYVGSTFGDVSGKTPAGISPISVTLGANYDHPFGNGDHLILRGDWHYESQTQIEDGLLGGVKNNPLTQQVISYQGGIDEARPFTRAVSEIDASLTYASRMGLELSVWGRNLTNDRYLTVVFDSPTQTGSVSAYVNQPRTYGVSARYKF
jgi:iron complex outermembrane receptor protein